MQFNDQHFAIKLKLSLIITGFVDFTLKEMLNDMNVVVIIFFLFFYISETELKKAKKRWNCDAASAIFIFDLE